MTPTANQLNYQRFDPAACEFPRPLVPVLPTFRFEFFNLVAARPAEDSDGLTFSRARYALHEAFRLAGLGPGATLLVPSYHCRTMYDGALSFGADIRFYRLNENLSPDLRHIASLLRQSGATQVIIAAHFFGLPQDLGSLARLSRSEGAVLIEDCSHALLTQSGADGASSDVGRSARFGRVGAYAVVSPYKFFPCEDGGVLFSGVTADMPPAMMPRQPSTRDEVRALVNTWQRAWRADTAVLRDIDAQNLRAAEDRPAGDDLSMQSSQPSTQYDAAQAQRASLRSSRWIAAHTDTIALVARRRQRYRQWAEALVAVPGARVWQPVLPEGSTPYMFPLLLDNPAVQFPLLKHLRLPIGRWDEMAETDCPVASAYRLGMIHLPCHQSLSDAQMAWMMDTVTQALRHAEKRHSLAKASQSGSSAA